MAINQVTVPKSFRTSETDFGTTICEALWKKVIRTQHYLEKSRPVGMLMFFHATQDSLPETPDTNYWKLCNGTAVSNSNSLLNGVTLPDLRDKFLKHPRTDETVLVSGGADTVNLDHNHSGGVTGATDNRGIFQMDNGGDRWEGRNHQHTIAAQTMTVSVVPSYIALQIWVRIV